MYINHQNNLFRNIANNKSNTAHDAMRNILIVVLCFFISVSISHASEICTQDNLKEYDFILSTNKIKENHSAKIFLPSIQKINGEFCGFWLHKKLTGNIKHQYYGYKGSNIYISLNPEISDAGLTINIANTDQWPQEGSLGRESMAGIIPIGKYRIVER